MKKLKAIFKILLALFIIALIIISIIKMQNRKCSGIQVNINYDGEYPHLNEQSIISLLDKEKVPIIGSKMKDISSDMEKFSDVLEKNNLIKKVENIDFNGTELVITVRLKTLLLHIYSEKGEQFFMDEDNFLLPFSPRIKERVMVANGAIKERLTFEKDTIQRKALYDVASAIRENPFCKAQFCQIYINENQDIELIPVVGQHIVYFGKGDRIKDKLSDIKTIYTNALAYKGIDQYKELDVRFQNRVIAKKR